MMNEATKDKYFNEMFDMLGNVAFYIEEANKLYDPFPQELMMYRERITDLLKKIENEG